MTGLRAKPACTGCGALEGQPCKMDCSWLKAQPKHPRATEKQKDYIRSLRQQLGLPVDKPITNKRGKATMEISRLLAKLEDPARRR